MRLIQARFYGPGRIITPTGWNAGERAHDRPRAPHKCRGDDCFRCRSVDV